MILTSNIIYPECSGCMREDSSTMLLFRLVYGGRHGVGLESPCRGCWKNLQVRVLQHSVGRFLALRWLRLDWWLGRVDTFGSFWLIKGKIWIFQTLGVGSWSRSWPMLLRLLLLLLLLDLVVVPVSLNAIRPLALVAGAIQGRLGFSRLAHTVS